MYIYKEKREDNTAMILTENQNQSSLIPVIFFFFKELYSRIKKNESLKAILVKKQNYKGFHFLVRTWGFQILAIKLGGNGSK